MYRSEGSHDQVDRDPRRDPRVRSQADGEVEIERTPIVADRPGDESGWPSVPEDRRRGDRRRIERTGTDI
jgi:hypothetical protein